jgi:serine/threonine-protein kinase
MVINGVRVCVREEFRIGKKGGQSDGVYVALGTDGSEKAVKLFLKATHDHLAEKEKKLLTTCNAKDLTHVVSYWFLDDESHNEFTFLFMELCEETLEKFVYDNSVDDLLKRAPGIIRQILKGLTSLHRKPKRILHRDLKPSNILRNVHDEWLLADFGIGRILLDDESTLETKQAGTKMWMPVESYGETGDEKVPYTAKSDIQVRFC